MEAEVNWQSIRKRALDVLSEQAEKARPGEKFAEALVKWESDLFRDSLLDAAPADRYMRMVKNKCAEIIKKTPGFVPKAIKVDPYWDEVEKLRQHPWASKVDYFITRLNYDLRPHNVRNVEPREKMKRLLFLNHLKIVRTVLSDQKESPQSLVFGQRKLTRNMRTCKTVRGILDQLEDVNGKKDTHEILLEKQIAGEKRKREGVSPPLPPSPPASSPAPVPLSSSREPVWRPYQELSTVADESFRAWFSALPSSRRNTLNSFWAAVDSAETLYPFASEPESGKGEGLDLEVPYYFA